MNSIKVDNRTISPSKVVCIGRNYVDHIKELNNDMPDEMVFFIKPNSSISNEVIYPQNQNSCHYEGEISFIIENNQISAVGFGLDMTLREVQSVLKKKGLPWERAKAFDASAVFSDFVSIEGGIEDLELELYINGELKQKGGIELMINKPSDIINDFKSFASFENGDILMTGTPKGVGEFKIGDVFLTKILNKDNILIQKEFIVK